MRQVLIIMLLGLISCKKDETKQHETKNIKYEVECDSCRTIMWKQINGQSIVTDTIVKNAYTTTYSSDVPCTLALSIKFEDYSKDTFPVKASIYVNDALVVSKTDTALNYGTNPTNKNWVFIQYLLSETN